MKFNKLAALGLFLLGASMAAAFGAHADDGIARVPVGNWGSIEGSNGVNMNVTENQTILTFGCSSVVINAPLYLMAPETFETTGMTSSLLPSNRIAGDPAIVAGKINGDTITLSVTTVQMDETGKGTSNTTQYTVKKGTVANFFHCG